MAAVKSAEKPVVVLRALGVGDLITGLPALRSLRRAFASREIVLLTPDALRPLVELTDCADRVVAMDGVRTVPQDAPSGIEPGCIAVNLHGRGPASHKLLNRLDPERLIAFGHSEVPGPADAPLWNRDEHEITRWCRMLREHGIECDEGDQLIECREDPGVTLPRVIVHPGAASEARRWPWTRWALVARAAEQAGFEVLLTAGPGEEALASALADASGLSADCVIAGLDLADLAELLNTAACVASTDTGVAHLATALRTRSVILFGPVTPSTWGPTIDNPRHTVIWRGRTGDPHSAGPDPGLLEIDARTVAAAVIGQASRAVMSFRPDAGKGVR